MAGLLNSIHLVLTDGRFFPGSDPPDDIFKDLTSNLYLET